VSITVYTDDGETILASGQAAGVGQTATVRFHAAAGALNPVLFLFFRPREVIGRINRYAVLVVNQT
jgi:hypothetical protein